MKYAIVDPRKFQKDTNYYQGLEICQAFLDLNHVPHPEFTIGHLEEMDAGGAWGLYIPAEKKIITDVHQCVDAGSGNPDKDGWFFSCGRSDGTPMGVVAHETGHHVHFSKDISGMIKDLDGVTNKEPRVTPYEPNVYEAIAEMMRIFILNPELLKEGRPKRWKYLTNAVGLKPLHNKPWKTILKHAHPRIIKATKIWIQAGRV